MPTREEMIAALQDAPPSREDMIAALQSGNASPPPDPSNSGVMDKAKQGLGYALQGLDYAGGLARTGAANLAQGAANTYGKVTGQDVPQVVTGADNEQALKGHAPSLRQYLERAGVPEMGRFSQAAPFLFSKDPNSILPTPGGNWDPSVRGALGMAGDIALDPLTYVGAGPGKALLPKGKISAVADAVLNPAEKTLQAGGESLYKSAPLLKSADAYNARFGKGPVSDLLFDKGVTGTGRSIATKAEAMAEGVGEERNRLLQAAGDQGAVVNMNQAMTPAQDFVEKLRQSRDPQMQDLAAALEERIDKYTELQARGPKEINISTKSGARMLDETGAPIASETQTLPGVRGVTPAEASQFKTNLYNDTGLAAWDNLRRTPQGSLANQKLAQGLDQAASAATDAVEPGLGTKINDLNDTWGQLLTPKKIMENEALKGERKNMITPVDAVVAGFGHSHPAILGAKKAADIGKTNWLRTTVGNGMYNAGEIPLADETLRRILIDRNQPTQSWDQLRR